MIIIRNIEQLFEQMGLLSTDLLVFRRPTAIGQTKDYKITVANFITALSDSSVSPIQNVVIVQKSPGTGEFLTIAEAITHINALGDASSTNPYKIEIGPGLYLESELSVPSFTSIVGSAIQPTILSPAGNHHLFNIQNTPSKLSFFTIKDVPLGYAGIFLNDCGYYGQAHKISFGNCDTSIWVKSITQDTSFFGEYIDCNGIYSFGTKVEATNGFAAFANLENYYNFPDVGIAAVGTYVTGIGASVEILASGNTAYGLGTGVYGENGAAVNISSTALVGWNNAIHIGNVGVLCTITVQGNNVQ